MHYSLCSDIGSSYIASSHSLVIYSLRMKSLTLDQIEQVVDSWKPEDRRRLLSQLAKRYAKDLHVDEERLESLGWMMLAQSSLGFWDNPEDAIYDRM